MNKKDRLDLANWAMKYTVKQGADQAAVSITKRRNIEIQHRDSKLEKIQESTQNSLSLRVYANHRYSVHSTCDLKKESLKTFINEAVSMTKYLSEDPYRELPDAGLYEGRRTLDLKINDPFYSGLESDARVQFAREIEESAMGMSDKIISATAGFYDTFAETVKVHSNGFSGESEGTVFSTGAEVTVEDADGKRPEDWYYASTRFFDMLPEPAELGKIGAERALRKVGQKKIDSGKMPMLVENRAVGRILGALRGPLSGRSLQQKRSFLEGMLNQKIASDILTMTDDPFVARGLGSRLYDSEGIAAHKMPVIEKGVLKNFYIDTYYGKKLEMKPTTGSTSNIVFELGAHSLKEMMAKMDRGILVTNFIGGNSNSTTGDFSYGLQGLLIEKGAVISPVSELNISGNMKEFLNQLVAVGNDPYPYSSQQYPSLMFDDVNIAGI